MEEIELLKKTVIDESLYEYCYVKDGIVYPPLIENNIVVMSGIERYNNKFNKPKEKTSFWHKFFRKEKKA